VESHDITVDRKTARVTITLKVVEGPQFKVKSLDITGNRVLPLEDIRGRSSSRRETCSPAEAARDRGRDHAALRLGRARLGGRGAPGRPESRRPNGGHPLEITEGPEVYVERINISGNVRSQEKILRREIPCARATSSRARSSIAQAAADQPGLLRDREGLDLARIGQIEDPRHIDVVEKPTGCSASAAATRRLTASSAPSTCRSGTSSARWEVSTRFRGGAAGTQGR